MKIIFEDGEEEKIKKGYEAMKNHSFYSPIFSQSEGNPNKEYSINFKIKNPELAEYVIRQLRAGNFDVGIELTSINLVPYQDQDLLRNRLHAAIDVALRGTVEGE